MAAQFHAQIMIPRLSVAVNFVERSSIRPGRFHRFNTFIEECRHAGGVTYGLGEPAAPILCGRCWRIEVCFGAEGVVTPEA